MAMPALDFSAFMSHNFIAGIKNNPRWTISTASKMPVDIPYLETYGQIIGASFANDNQPLVDLNKLKALIVDQNQLSINNVAYYLKQALDNFFVLDIEPKCPLDIRNRLLTLPYVYAEYSMSGKGFHLVFKRPKNPPVQRPELFTAKPAIKHPDGIYEFLLNHYVTFTGAIISPVPGTARLPESELWTEFDKISKDTKIMRTFDIDTDKIPELDGIQYGGLIIDVLTEDTAAYRKTPDDFGGDESKYEFGAAGFYYKRMNSLLSTTAYERHDYTPEERIRLLYEVILRMIPYRKKHEESREGLPWLMYTAKRIVTVTPDKK